MHLVANTRRFPDTIPLRNAVLCVQCESVSSARFDKCPVCGSASVFSIAPILGGSLTEEETKQTCNVTFNVRISIAFRQIDGADVNTALSGITELVALKLGRTQASLHIDVEPLSLRPSDEKLQAA